MKIGDFVKVKDGLKDPEYQLFDMSGWTGVISQKFDKVEGEIQVIVIEWDIATLNKLPVKYISSCIEDSCEFETMTLAEEDVHLMDNDKKDTRTRKDVSNFAFLDSQPRVF